jgi:predicted dehydrogenase
MTRLCDENGVALVVNHTRRFASEYQRAKKLLDNGAIGTPLSAVCHFSGSIVHTGTHAYDILRYLFGEAVWVEANLEAARLSIRNMLRPGDTNLFGDTGGHGLIAFEGGVHVAVHGDSRNYFIFEFDIMGTEGRLRIGNWLFELYQAAESARESGLRELHKRKAGRRKATSPAVPALLHLLGCMEDRTRNISGPRDGTAALEIALALQRSHDTGGGRIALPLQDRTLRVVSR